MIEWSKYFTGFPLQTSKEFPRKKKENQQYHPESWKPRIKIIGITFIGRKIELFGTEINL